MKKLFPILLLMLMACKKDPPPEPQPEAYENGVILLNEGLFQQNNASVSFYSFTDAQTYHQIFQSVNQRGLGDTANDMKAFTINGVSYLIIAVDVSSQLEIVRTNSMVSVAQIPLFNGTIAKEPRRLAIDGQNAWVACYDGTVQVVDLNTTTVIQEIQAGQNPDGILVRGNYVYVANSGGLNYPDYDSTLTIIDKNSFQVIDEIVTRINCSSMITDGEGDIYLFSAGNYGSIGTALVKIDTQLNSVTGVFEMTIGAMSQYQDMIYYYDADQMGVRRFNMLTDQAEPGVLIDCSSYDTFYKVMINPVNGDIYCVDAKNYVNSSLIHRYSLSGVHQESFTGGLNTTQIVVN